MHSNAGPAKSRGPFGKHCVDPNAKWQFSAGDAAAQKLTEAATLLDRAGEERLAADATELAERVNLRIAMN